MVEQKFGDALLYAPRFDVRYDDITVLFVLDEEGWQSRTYSWLSPVAAKLLTKHKLNLVCQPTSNWDSLIRTAARAGFWKWSKTVLATICRHRGVAVLPASPQPRASNAHRARVPTCVPLRMHVVSEQVSSLELSCACCVSRHVCSFPVAPSVALLTGFAD